MSRIKQNVMIRVKAVRLMRPFVSDTAAAVVLFLIALYGIGREVWVAKVIANMPPLFDVAAVAHFLVAAFVNTEFVVQVLAVLVAGMGVWIARNIAENILPLVRREPIF